MPDIRIRLRDESGKPLSLDDTGAEVPLVIPATAREPSLRHRTGTGLSLFVAEGTDAEGDWIYRRVGVEREV